MVVAYNRVDCVAGMVAPLQVQYYRTAMPGIVYASAQMTLVLYCSSSKQCNVPEHMLMVVDKCRAQQGASQ